MTQYSLIFHFDAVKDYVDAYHWYQLQEMGLGDRFLRQMRLKIEQILDQPATYGMKSKKGYREATIKDFPYSIVYKIHPENIIFISSIHHEKLHPNKKFRK